MNTTKKKPDRRRKARCYQRTAACLAFEQAGAWVRFDRIGRHVVIDKCDEVKLNSAQCLDIAKWLAGGAA